MSLVSLCRCLQQHSESRGFYWPKTWGVGQAVIYPWCSTTVWGKILLKRYRPLLTATSARPEPTMPFSRKTRQVWNQGRLTFSKVETRLFIFFPSSTFKIQMKAARSHFFIWGLLKRFSENSRGFPTEAGKTWNTFATIYSDFVCLCLELIMNTDDSHLPDNYSQWYLLLKPNIGLPLVYFTMPEDWWKSSCLSLRGLCGRQHADGINSKTQLHCHPKTPHTGMRQGKLNTGNHGFKEQRAGEHTAKWDHTAKRDADNKYTRQWGQENRWETHRVQIRDNETS